MAVRQYRRGDRPGHDFIPLCDEILIGWIKFNGKGEPPDRIGIAVRRLHHAAA